VGPRLQEESKQIHMGVSEGSVEEFPPQPGDGLTLTLYRKDTGWLTESSLQVKLLARLSDGQATRSGITTSQGDMLILT
jgi:hypothetical protein